MPRRRRVAIDAYLERDDGALFGFRDAGLAAAIDQRDREMEQKIDDARLLAVRRAEEAGQRLGKLGADAGQRADRAEQGREQGGAHGAVCVA